MASKRPIVASDLPSIREVVDERMAYFAKPDDEHDLAAAIKTALRDPDARLRAAHAFDTVKNFSWRARTRTVLRAL